MTIAKKNRAPSTAPTMIQMLISGATEEVSTINVVHFWNTYTHHCN